MASQLQPVRGTHDLLPDSYAQHHRVIETASDVARLYGFARMDTPMFEFSEVFHRAVGETSDIVSKETYTFTDRGGESITLRPEFTAAIVRSFISNGLQQTLPFKCFYAGPAFRYERPQKGRLRQFHQIGAELLGASDPSADVEMIALAAHTLRQLGLLEHVKLHLNSLGDSASRSVYRDDLVQYFKQHEAKLSEESKVRLVKNPLRILDSKDPQDRELVAQAPKFRHQFNEVSQQFFDAVKRGLDSLGIHYTSDPRLVRGLDYYSHTVFEFVTDKLGAQGTVLAGGRYDGLVKHMGGQDVAGIGFAAGVERLVALMDAPVEQYKPIATIIPMDEAAEVEGWKIAQLLRAEGIATDIAYKGNAKKRFERANKIGAAFAVVIGQDELARGEVTLKNLVTGVQQTLAREALVAALKTDD
jgi:histidyl-tRNA synthetase